MKKNLHRTFHSLSEKNLNYLVYKKNKGPSFKTFYKVVCTNLFTVTITSLATNNRGKT